MQVSSQDMSPRAARLSVGLSGCHEYTGPAMTEIMRQSGPRGQPAARSFSRLPTRAAWAIWLQLPDLELTDVVTALCGRRYAALYLWL
jgi:hypothetical protein